MRGQLSIEFLVIILIGIAFLGLMLPVVSSVKDAGDLSINMRSAERLSNLVYDDCKLNLLQGDGSSIKAKFFAPTGYKVVRKNSILSISFSNYSFNRSIDFTCAANAIVKEGSNQLKVSKSLVTFTSIEANS